MSNIVRKGDFLAFENTEGNVTEFFVSKSSFDLDNCYTGRSGRKFVPHCFGFKMVDSFIPSGYYYAEGISYWITRKATLEERDRFLQWMEEKGHKFNMNTLELTLNR